MTLPDSSQSYENFPSSAESAFDLFPEHQAFINELLSSLDNPLLGRLILPPNFLNEDPMFLDFEKVMMAHCCDSVIDPMGPNSMARIRLEPIPSTEDE
jgi:hypothetical protein